MRWSKKKQRPLEWLNTRIIQIYKGKGDSADLNNHRNIHTKEYLPKTFETIFVEKSKAKIVEKCSKYQVGAMPGHRVQEHLFTIKSIMSYYNWIDKALILNLWDLSKYFDKEVVADVMDSLYRAGIRGKLYRLWSEFNSKSVVQVVTPSGISEKRTTGANVGQGTVGGGLASALGLSDGMADSFDGSSSEIYYGPVRVQPIMFQDDILKCSDDIKSAQDGCYKMEVVTGLKQLQINIDKSVFMLLGNKSRVGEIREMITRNPLLFKGQALKEKQFDKYLGDQIGESTTASVEKTVSDRYWRIMSFIREVQTVISDCRAETTGAVTSGLLLWQMAGIPVLLNNAGSWLSLIHI